MAVFLVFAIQIVSFYIFGAKLNCTMAQITPEEAKPKRPMWRSIYHDTENDRMYVWYTDGTMDAVPSVHEFYTDKQGEYGAKPCGMRDIWDREVYKVEVPPANGISACEVEKAIKQNHAGPTNHLAEIDIDPRGRFYRSIMKTRVLSTRI